MKFLIKKIYITLFLILIILRSNVFAKDANFQYNRENVSNYFFGVVLLNQDNNKEAFKHLKKVKSLKDKHSKYNVEFTRTLILLEKFNEAFSFSKNIWREEEFLFETDLLLGLESLTNHNYITAEKHFKRLNKISKYNPFFGNFLGNVLLAWNKAAEGKEDDSFAILEKISSRFIELKKTQNSFLHCYFDNKKTFGSFENLIKNENYNFSRYDFFLVNYLLHKDRITEANKIIKTSASSNSSNLLTKQTEEFLKKKRTDKIISFFNCQNLEDNLAEFFYIIANIYSSEQDYQMSNFYIKISLFLNKKFNPNRALLAENFYYQKKKKESQNEYLSLKSIGEIYSWYASTSIASILSETKGKKYSIQSLEKDFKTLKNPSFEHYYELANFYKDNDYYEKSIEYYSLAIKKLEQDHYLIPKILDRRGTSFERMGDWEKAEKDLIKSLELSPDQPYVLNYLAYSWVDKGINLDMALEMLEKATELKKNDGYIIDSLGWAYYSKKDFIKAEHFLQKAVELMPYDPVINDHYADTLWMLNKNIQARYFWKHVLKLNATEKELRDTVNEKLLFGIHEQL